MNDEEFQKAAADLTGGVKVDFQKLPKWFEGILGTLETLGKQKAGVHHPGRRGTAREHLLGGVLAEMLPSWFTIETGFAINHYSIESKEQDLLLVDEHFGSRLLPEENCFPIESCLASVQVKSVLTRSAIRESTINCMSIKRLFGWPLVPQEQSDGEYDKLCYAVFSYASDLTLEKLAIALNEELSTISRHLWPNMFYVLGKGLLIPGEDKGVPLDASTMFTGPKYLHVEGISAPGLPSSEAYAFLWFLSNILDHCSEQQDKREKLSLQRYWLFGIETQTWINANRGEGGQAVQPGGEESVPSGALPSE